MTTTTKPADAPKDDREFWRLIHAALIAAAKAIEKFKLGK